MAKRPRKKIRPSFEDAVLARVDRERHDVVTLLFRGTYTFEQLVRASGLPVREVRWLIRRHQHAEREAAAAALEDE